MRTRTVDSATHAPNWALGREGVPLAVDKDTGELLVKAAVSVPAPEGGATEDTLASIDGKTPALASGRVPVDGSGVTQPVSMAAPAAAGTGAAGVSWFRAPTSDLLDDTVREVKATAGNLLGYSFINPNAVPSYVKFFNAATGDVTPGTTIPVHVVHIPANDGTNDGYVFVPADAFPLRNFSTAISALATSVRADTGAQTAPAAGLLAEIAYA